MRNYRKASLMIGFILVVFGFVFKAFYRPVAISSGISDLGFSNSAPSLFYVAGFSLLLLVHRDFRPVVTILFVVTASIIYEIYQARSFVASDFSDICYSIAGGIVAFVVHSFFTRTTRNR